MKKKIKEDLESCIEQKIIDNKIDNIINLFNAYKNKYPNHELSIRSICYDSWIEMYLQGIRDETDEEYEYRTAKGEKKKQLDAENATKSQEKNAEKEYQKYLELKKKYEGKDNV